MSDTTQREIDEKALRAAIGYAPVRLSIRDYPEITWEHRTAEDADGLVERILEAGFTLANDGSWRDPEPFVDPQGRVRVASDNGDSFWQYKPRTREQYNLQMRQQGRL